MEEPTVRLSRPNDINTLGTLDLKSYAYPLTMDNWRSLVNGSGKKCEPRVVLLELFRKPVGFAMWIRDEENMSKVFLLRVGIVPMQRRRGLGTVLVNQCVRDCLLENEKLEQKLLSNQAFAKGENQEPIREIHIAVPDIHCIPNDPDNVVGFLNNSDFRPNGDIISKAKIMYGNPVDAYIFVRSLP